MTAKVHTIFVPSGMSVEQVWETIKRGLCVSATSTAGVWVNVDQNGKVLV